MIKMNKTTFKPHTMYDPDTGKGIKAKTYAEHLALKKKGYSHSKPKSNQTASAIEERMSKLY